MYIKYWSAVEANEEKHVVSGIQDGFDRLGSGQVVLHALSMIRT